VYVQSGTPAISDNTITTSYAGIFHADGGGTASGNTIGFSGGGPGRYGISAGGTATPILDGNTILDDEAVSDIAISTLGTAAGVQIINNTIHVSGGDRALQISPALFQGGSQVSGNDFPAGLATGIEIGGQVQGTAAVGALMPAAGTTVSTYVVSSLNVPADTTLALAAGVTLTGGGSPGTLSVSGTLTAVGAGTGNRNVVFNDVLVTFQPGSMGTMQFCTVQSTLLSYAMVLQGTQTLDSCTVTVGGGGTYGIYVGGGSPAISSNTITAPYGVYVQSGTPAISDNTITTSYAGIFYADGGGTASGNTIGFGGGGPGRYGVYVAGAAAPIVKGNTIYDDPLASDSGIEVAMGAGNAMTQIVNNMICTSGGETFIALPGGFAGTVSGNLNQCGAPTSTPTDTTPPTSTRTPTIALTPTQTSAAIATLTATGAPSATAANTATASATAAATETPSATPAATATASPTSSPEPSPAATPSESATTTVTLTPTETATATPPATATSPPTLTATASPAPSATATPTGSATPSPSPPPTATSTPSPSAPVPSSTATPTATKSDTFVITGVLLGPGSLGMTDNLGRSRLVDERVDLLDCSAAGFCLNYAMTPLLTVFTDDTGRYTFQVPLDLVRRRRYILIRAVFGPVLCRRLLTPTDLRVLSGEFGDGGGAQQVDLILDPIAEAASRLLVAAGADSYSDESIEALRQSVETANATANFAGLTVAAANDQAETTAAADTAVRMILDEARRTPTPIHCVGDCGMNGVVTVEEVVRGVAIVLGSVSFDLCPEFDADAMSGLTQSELRDAVSRALEGC
jgi:hypothetical protein